MTITGCLVAKWSVFSVSTDKVEIEISKTMIAFPDFSLFLAFSSASVSSTDQRVVSLIFTVSLVVISISIAAMAAAHISLLLSLLALAPLLGPW